MLTGIEHFSINLFNSISLVSIKYLFSLSSLTRSSIIFEVCVFSKFESLSNKVNSFDIFSFNELQFSFRLLIDDLIVTIFFKSIQIFDLAINSGSSQSILANECVNLSTCISAVSLVSRSFMVPAVLGCTR